MYKAYIQALNGMFTDDWAYSAYIGFKRKQMDIYLFENIEEVPASKYNIVVGYIEETKKQFERLGIDIPSPLNIPYHLTDYCKRRVEVMTMGRFKQQYDRQDKLPIFIKPESKVKEFIAGVVTRPGYMEFFFNEVPDNSLVLTSEVLDIVSEYRCFVIEGELKGIHHYTGDFCIFPDTDIIKSAIEDYTYAPSGYSIDFGVTKQGETVLIECNDGWSLGTYGFEPSAYVNLLTKRWIELTKHLPY